MNDLIRKKDAIDAIEGITSGMSICVNSDECHGMKRMQRQAVLEIANMPSAEPERKKGRWTRPTRPNTYERFCSECQEKAWFCGKEIKKDDCWNEIIWHGPVIEQRADMCLECWDDALFHKAHEERQRRWEN